MSKEAHVSKAKQRLDNFDGQMMIEMIVIPNQFTEVRSLNRLDRACK